MSTRPPVVRKYGRSTRPAPSYSSSSGPSLIFESSPPSSPLLATPHPSSDLDLDFTIETDSTYGSSSPIQPAPAVSSKGKQKENVPVATVHLASVNRPVQSTLASFFELPTPTSSSGPSRTKKRPLDVDVAPRPATPLATHKREGLTQMHLTHLPLLHTCQQCQMSYVRGGEDDGVHDRHHASVTRGIVWGDGMGSSSRRKNASGTGDKGYRVVRDHVDFGTKGKGKVVLLEVSHGGSKLDEILRTVDTVLSSPPLPPAILAQCKIFLFITASPAPTKRLRPGYHNERIPKERIVAVVVAQPIKWAMRVLRPDEPASGAGMVDSGEGVLCDPTRLDTPLGIHRLFTIPSYRALGLSRVLLDAACQYTVYGCHFDPLKGDVAFSQPTNSGKGVMDHWGQGHVRVFVDDESQL